MQYLHQSFQSLIDFALITTMNRIKSLSQTCANTRSKILPSIPIVHQIPFLQPCQFDFLLKGENFVLFLLLLISLFCSELGRGLELRATRRGISLSDLYVLNSSLEVSLQNVSCFVVFYFWQLPFNQLQ